MMEKLKGELEKFRKSAFRRPKEFTPEKGEKIEWEGRPSRLAFFPVYGAGILALLCSLLVGWAWLVILSLCFLVFFVWLTGVLQRSYRFILTNRRIRAEFRLWVTFVREARLESVVNTYPCQNLLERVLGLGRVSVDTPYRLGTVTFFGLRDFDEVNEKIHKLLHR
jgi:hypothetical protein